MLLDEYKNIIKQVIGHDPDSLGDATITNAVNRRIHESNAGNPRQYLQTLKKSKTELQNLIDLVVIPETWFFRDEEPFVFLKSHVVNYLPLLKKGQTLKILSLPCSTGEEPYSIAMSLVQCGLASFNPRIDAIDVCHHSLIMARAAIYRNNSFRSKLHGFRGRFFDKTDDGYKLHDSICNMVTFSQGNILKESYDPGDCQYDYIFCRNLLIYFDRPTSEMVINKLVKALKWGGVLVLGHAESGMVTNKYLKSVDFTKSFAFTKNKQSWKANKEQSPAVDPELLHKLREFNNSRVKTDDISSEQKEKQEPSEDTSRLLDSALQMADCGDLSNARKVCEKIIELSDPVASTYYLLGLIADAEGDKEQSEQYLRKTLYLDPDHYEALTHMARLMENNGDHKSSLMFKRRAERVHQRLNDQKAG